MTLVVIDYGGGNLKSVASALDRLAVPYVVSSDPKVVAEASCVIFPGQGAAGQVMAQLKKTGLDEVIRSLTVPYLGICIGMQILYEATEEDGGTTLLGIVDGVQARFDQPKLKIPQMGWNAVKFSGYSRLFEGIPDESDFYFVHSYRAPLLKTTLGVSWYGGPFTAVVQQDNFYGVQFHPEKSGDWGQRLLRNFIEKC
jgi:glutamine amidotransferase